MPVPLNTVGMEIRIEILKASDGVTFPVNTFASKEIILRAPSGALKVKTASFVTDGTDGKIKYLTENGDLDELGKWYYRGRVYTGTTLNFPTNWDNFVVQEIGPEE